jgi:hypothetical protein
MNTKMKNIHNSLQNSEDLGILITKELHEQTDKLNVAYKKTNIIYDKLILGRNKLNKIILSIPSLSFLKKSDNNIINNKSIVNFINEDDEMDNIRNRLLILKNISNDINFELKKQNTVIDNLTNMNDNSLHIIKENNQNIQKLL